MKTINEPRYQSFTGETFRIAQAAERADREYRTHILKELENLKKYCKNSNCSECPFCDEYDYCEIKRYIRADFPEDWTDWE